MSVYIVAGRSECWVWFAVYLMSEMRNFTMNVFVRSNVDPQVTYFQSSRQWSDFHFTVGDIFHRIFTFHQMRNGVGVRIFNCLISEIVRNDSFVVLV